MLKIIKNKNLQSIKNFQSGMSEKAHTLVI